MSRNTLQPRFKPVTGQINPLNTFGTSQNNVNENELKDSVQNSIQNPFIDGMEEESVLQNDIKILGINFRMEISYDNQPNQEEILATIYDKVIQLLNAWIQSKDIVGVYGLDHHVITQDLEDNVKDWGRDPRIIAKKQLMTVDLCLELQTEKTTFQLFQSQKEACEKFCIKLETKKTDMEYTKRIGFVSSVYVQEASTDYYAKELTNQGTKVFGVKADGLLEVKKQFTFERGTKSKVLVVYAVESEADRVDQALMTGSFKHFQYVSYKRTATHFRVAAMHANEVLNVKARFETLYGVSVNELILHDNKEYVLEDFIMEQVDQEQKLFLAVEQSYSKYGHSVKVILNPKMKNKARKWIVEVYPQVIFQQPKEISTSVDVAQFQASVKYNEELKAFLKPILSGKEASRVKQFSKKMKSYAQALGIESNESGTQNQQHHQQPKNKEKEKVKDTKQATETEHLKSTIQVLSKQIDSLKGIIHSLCNILPESPQKNEALKVLDNMKDNTDAEVEVIEQKRSQDEGVSSNKKQDKKNAAKLVDSNPKGKRKSRAVNAFSVNKDDLAGKLSLLEFGVEWARRKNRKVDEQLENE